MKQTYIIPLIFGIFAALPAFSQLDDQAVSFSYRFGFGKVPVTELDKNADLYPQNYIGGNKWCRSNEFDVTWHFLPNLGATMQFGGSAFNIDTIAFENKLLDTYDASFANTLVPRAYKSLDWSIGPTGFIAIDNFYAQASGLFGMVIQRSTIYDVYLFDYRGQPSDTYQFDSRGPIGWVAEGNIRAGIMTDGDVRIGGFIGGNYRYSLNRVKIDTRHFDNQNRSVSDSNENFKMTLESWQIQLGIQLLIGG